MKDWIEKAQIPRVHRLNKAKNGKTAGREDPAVLPRGKSNESYKEKREKNLQ